jgi:CARDB protein
MRNLRVLAIAIPLALLTIGTDTAPRGPSTTATGDSLWLGNDHHPPASHINPDGTLINSLDENITGFTYDGEFLYSASAFVMQLTKRDPSDGSNPVPLMANPGCAGVCEDLAFDGEFIWRMEHANTTIHKLDKTTGGLLQSIALTVSDPDGRLDPLGGYGIAWDGSKLWLSFGPQTGCPMAPCGVVTSYDIGTGINTFEFHTDFEPGGLAFDGQGNLWAGGYANKLRKMTTTGTVLATIDVPEHSGGFSDGLEYIASDPDLVVSAVSNPPAVVIRGQKFSVTDTTLNQGGSTAGASITRYYLSLDQVRGPGDKRLGGKRLIPALASGASSTGTVNVKVKLTTKLKTYYLLACADDKKLVPESDEGNNCIASETKVEVRAAALSQPQ